MGVIHELRSSSRHHLGRSFSRFLPSSRGQGESYGGSSGTDGEHNAAGSGGGGAAGSNDGGAGAIGRDMLRIQPAAATTTTAAASTASATTTTTTTHGMHRNINQLRNRLGKSSLPTHNGMDNGADSILKSSSSSSLRSSSSSLSSSSSSSSSSSLSSSKLGSQLLSSSSSPSSSSSSSSSSLSSSPSILSSTSSSSSSILSHRSSSSSSSSYSSTSSPSSQLAFKQRGSDMRLFRKFPFKYQTYNAESQSKLGNDDDSFHSFKGSDNIARYGDDRLTHTALEPKSFNPAFKHAPDRIRQSQHHIPSSPNGHAQNLTSPMSSSLSSSSSLLSPSQPSSLVSPLSSSISPAQSNFNNNIYNLGLHHGSTLSPISNPALDMLSPTGESPNSWNISEICYNSSSSAATLLECWNLFDPNDNLSTSEPSTPSPESSTASFMMPDDRFWAIFLVIFPLFTVFGNVLVVLSVFKEKSLKTVTNYFICSLAVADIMVAVVVMPFAVYMEVTDNVWALSDPLCDAWVASDVLACTASILNLTAISVDRFIAVTQPIKYAKHKNSKRVFIMLAVTWVISVAIAAPIALGVNYSEERKPGLCRFFNSDFLIYSSMGSFYIPSIIMIFLYWKIYRVIRQRALKARKAKQLKNVDRRALQGVIENPQATTNSPTRHNAGGPTMVEATVTTGLAKMDNGRVTTYNTTTSTRAGTSLLKQMSDAAASGRDSNAHNSALSEDSHDDDDDDDEETPSGSGSGSANNNTDPKGGPVGLSPQRNAGLICNVDVPELITNPMAEAIERQEAEEEQAMLQFGQPGHPGGEGLAATLPVGQDGSGASGSGSASTSGAGVSAGPTCANEAETNFGSPAGNGNNGENKRNNSCKRGHKKGVTKFNFHMRTSRKRKEKSSSKREKKATKTLAIVLGVFLICWVPFFTLNIISAICIRYNLTVPICTLEPIYLGLFVWLGYINSFLNPVIYTIFNPEFRKAFRRLLTEPCNS